MNLTARFFLLIAGVSAVSLLSGSASANPAALKCNSQRDQIWVYDSLNTFGVETKLKCGDNVEIIERVTNYVKIRAQNGVEGYIFPRPPSPIFHRFKFAKTRLLTLVWSRSKPRQRRSQSQLPKRLRMRPPSCHPVRGGSQVSRLPVRRKRLRRKAPATKSHLQAVPFCPSPRSAK